MCMMTMEGNNPVFQMAIANVNEGKLTAQSPSDKPKTAEA